MLKFRNSNSSPLEIVILGVFVVAISIFILSYFPKTNSIINILIRDFDPELSSMIKQWKNNADLVIVGRLVNRYDEVSSSHMGDYTGLVFFDLAVQKVERGQYPYDEIEVYVGTYSNVINLEDYPPFLKKNYRAGDLVRIYVCYDYAKNAYYTPGALMTVEPVT
jgi:hypothetical protein